MRNLSRKITTTITLLATITIGTTLSGCSGLDDRPEFKPPQYPQVEPKFIYERTIRSSADIRDVTAAMKLQFFATGTTESAIGLSKPFGIAVNKGRIFVSDSVQRAVVVFDIPRGEGTYIGAKEGPGMLFKPLGIDYSSAREELFVADITDKSIKIYDREGNFKRAHKDTSLFDRPAGVAVSPDGSKAYVIDSGGVDSSRHHMHIFDANTFELIRTVGQRGKEPGDFNLPMQVATAPDGTVYVIDGGNFRVQSFTSEGDFIDTFGSAGRYGGNFSRPKGIATDQDNNVYVGDSAFGNFQIFNSEGQLLLFIGDRGNRGGPGIFMLPSGIEVDEDGRVYYADQFFRKIDIFRPANLTEEDGYLGTIYKEQVREEMEREKNR